MGIVRGKTWLRWAIAVTSVAAIALTVILVIGGPEPHGPSNVSIEWYFKEEDPGNDDEKSGFEEGHIIHVEDGELVIDAPWEALGFHEMHDHGALEMMDYSLHIRLETSSESELLASGFAVGNEDERVLIYASAQGIPLDQYGIDNTRNRPAVNIRYGLSLSDVCEAIHRTTGRAANIHVN